LKIGTAFSRLARVVVKISPPEITKFFKTGIETTLGSKPRRLPSRPRLRQRPQTFSLETKSPASRSPAFKFYSHKLQKVVSCKNIFLIIRAAPVDNAKLFVNNRFRKKRMPYYYSSRLDQQLNI